MKLQLAIIFLMLSFGSRAQTSATHFTFIEYQKSFPRISEALKRKEDTLMKQFQEKKLVWPAKYIYLRSFKYDSQLEVWVKAGMNEKYKLFKTYKVCALAGSLGPKRMQGDYQVPEGFYYINEFNPKSTYHLSLGLNYPNISDRILGDSLQPGGDIYIHGKCVTTGCIPIMDQQIEELYILAAHAKTQGQDFIPVHILPIDFKNVRSTAYLNRYLKDFPEYVPMVNELKHAYNYFEKTKKLPIIMVSQKGDYIVEGVIPPDPVKDNKPVRKSPARPVKQFNQAELATVVDKLPVYPGGNEGFQIFLDQTSKEMIQYLGDEQQKTYVMIEFIIDKEGKPAYAKVLKGGNEELNDRLEEKFEKMSVWTPAVRTEKNVAIKLKQTVIIDKSAP
ncbi:MAG: L,D-transpeptidase family protein [Chitinophagaceae bacterium]|nr:L,D-transpeptidase family protein [Chitinophagaceae bacterium]